MVTYNRLNRIREHPLGGVALFMAITLVFHLLWRLGRPVFEEGALFLSLADFTTERVYLAAAWVNERIMGEAIQRMDAICTFQIAGEAAGQPFTGRLIVDHSCSGLKQFYQALVLFLLYPGQWKHKLWYIPLAIFVMHIINILRIIVLSLTMQHAYQHWDLVHDWVVRPLFYVVLFALWVMWDKHFSSSTI